MVAKPLLISLFSGPGGLDLGFKQAGFETLLAYDKDSACVATHRLNHPEGQALQEDLAVLAIEDVIAEWEQRAQGAAPQGIIGGPPCQSFSYANTNQSEGDARHDLPNHYARILRGVNERYGLDFFLFENVLGLKQLHREKFERFKDQFREAGFNLFEQELEAWQFGVPQLRPRVFLIGVNRVKYPDLTFRFPEPITEKPRTVRDAIGDLPHPAYFSKDLRTEDIPYHPNHWCMNPKSLKFRNGLLQRPGKFGKSFVVLDWDKPSLTVAYGHREVHVHPSGERRLSVYEAMLLQGFPHEYRLLGTLSDQIRLVSEVVAPPVAYHLARALAIQLGYQQGNDSKSEESAAD